MPSIDAETITEAGKISDELWPTDVDLDGPESQLARTRATLSRPMRIGAVRIRAVRIRAASILAASILAARSRPGGTSGSTTP